MGQKPKRFELRGPGWSSGPVIPALRSSERLRGLRPAPRAAGLLLRARSVHGFGMRVPLWAVSLDRSGTVRRVARLEPRGLVVDPGAAWILELPMGRVPPRPGLVLRAGLSWAGGRNADPVRRADRQPG